MFSLIFSSAGKGPFMARKGKRNVPEAYFPGGGREAGVRSEGHGFDLAVKFTGLLIGRGRNGQISRNF